MTGFSMQKTKNDKLKIYHVRRVSSSIRILCSIDQWMSKQIFQLILTDKSIKRINEHLILNAMLMNLKTL